MPVDTFVCQERRTFALFDSLDDLIRHEMQTAEHDETQSAISSLAIANIGT